MVSGRGTHADRMQIVRLLKQTSLEWFQSRAFEFGAAMAFYAIFSITPVIVLAFTIASLVLGPEAAQGRLAQDIESSVGHTVAVAIQATAQHTYRSGSSVAATILSIIFFGFGATGFFSQLQSALNAVWEVEPKPGRGLRGILRDRLGSFLAVLGASALLLAALLVTAALSAIGRTLPSLPTLEGLPLWRSVTFVVVAAFLTLAIALVYRILPDAKIAWRDVWVGASATLRIEILRLARWVPRCQEQKKPTWRNTQRHSTTSAYSLTSPPTDGVALYLVVRRF